VAKGSNANEVVLSFGPGTFNNANEPPTLVATPRSTPDKFGASAIFQTPVSGDGQATFSVVLQADLPQKVPSGFFFFAYQHEAYVGE
jgi:hypothetical protein